MRRCAGRHRWRWWLCLLGVISIGGCSDAGRLDRGVPAGGIASTTGVDPGPSDDEDEDEGTEGGSSESGASLPDLGGPDSPGTCTQDVDIVFVMDVTGSMGEFIETLVDELDAVDAAVQALDLPSEPRYGLVVFADDFALLNAGQAFDDLASLKAEFATWIEFTHHDEQIGGGQLNESFPENSLDALHAATKFAWRPADSTTRVVIHTTDDRFWDGPGVFNGEMVAHDYTETVAALQAAAIRVFAFAARRGGDCECTDVAPGWFEPYDGAPSIPEATDGGVFNILHVEGGSLSLGDAIPQAVGDAVCEPYEPVG